MDVRTDNDKQHRALARGAVVEAARAVDEDADLNDVLVTDVVEEAGLAWLMTGLLPSSLSQRDMEEICSAIVGRVATVLVMVGWHPPARLLDAAPRPVCAVHPTQDAAPGPHHPVGSPEGHFQPAPQRDQQQPESTPSLSVHPDGEA
jgi:hypothetical protein